MASETTKPEQVRKSPLTITTANHLEESVDRMTIKLKAISTHARIALANAQGLPSGARYMILTKALANIGDLVRDTLSVQNYWYTKFVESGALIQPPLTRK